MMTCRGFRLTEVVVAHTSARHPRRRRLLLVASIVAAMALVAGLLDAVGVFGGWGRSPAASAGSPVAVRPVKGRKVPVPAMRPWTRPHTSWPTAQTATAVIAAGARAAHHAHRLQAGPSAGSGRAGTLPVWIGAPDTAAKGTATTAVVSPPGDRKSTRLNSSHLVISYAVFCLKKKNHTTPLTHTNTQHKKKKT